MSIARSTGRPRSSRPTSSAPSRCWTRRGATTPTLTPARRAAFRFHHISTDEVFGALGPDDPPFDETTPLRSAQPLFGEQGGVGPSGARLVPHLRAADHRLQHRQQLRPVAVPGEADPAGHAERAGGQAAAGLRRRLQPARLDLRRGPRRRAGARAGAGRAGRHLHDRRPPAAQQPRRGARDLRRAGSPAAGPGRSARAADPFRHRPARATISATRSTRREPRRRWPGPRRTISRPGWRAPSTGTWRIATGGRRCAPGATPGQRLGTAA